MYNLNKKVGFSFMAMMVIAVIIVETSAKPPSKIRGGQDVGPNEGSFVVRLSLTGTRHASECTGAIISRRHILTAGHCIDGRDRGTVYGGTRHRSDQNPITTNIARVYKHPQFGTAYGGYDIGIVEVDSDLDLTGRQTSIPITTSEINFNARGTQFGWSDCGADNQMALQKMNVGFLTKEECANHGSYDQYPQLLCIDSGMAQSCGGDSGGPVVSGGHLVGVHTLGANNRGDAISSQNVYHYRDWINSIINQWV